MPVKIIYKNRRCGTDRRTCFPTDNDTERRSGVDRRKLEEKLKHMIDSNIKDQQKEKKTLTQLSSGTVIRRRKGEKGKPPIV